MNLSAAAPVDGKTAALDAGDFPLPSRARLLRYMLVLILPALLLILIAIPWTRYRSTAPGKWMMPAMDYRYTLRDINADVVISGDSTGLVALDPLTMQPDLHMSVINLASLGSIFNVQLDDMLDHYLRYNKPPKLIVVSLSPWNLRQEPVTAGNSFEGIVMLVRHGTWGEIFSFVGAHPMVTLNFEFQVLRYLLNPRNHGDPALHQQFVEHHGFAPIDPPSLQRPCKLIRPYTDPQVLDGLAVHFYKKYSSPATKVLIYMAPVGDCAGSDEFRKPHEHHAWLVPSAVVPATDICQDGMHMESYASTKNSLAVDQDIKKYLTDEGVALP